VKAFIDGKIPFTGIAEIVSEAVENHQTRSIGGLEEIFDIDRETRGKIRNLIDQRL
jgi:1-deoxy-D-xylulose 5-phosphate reductoisomerase